MTYREDQRQKATALRNAFFRDPGGGHYANLEREFVLEDATLNLWAGIRDDALAYFRDNSIAWHMGGHHAEPTGHLLSSQAACLNHLYFLRQREDAAAAILKNVCGRIERAERIDDGFVAFEVLGKDNYLNERSQTRGANATAVDAAMIGRKPSGSNILLLIEWKYTEAYGEKDRYIPARYEIYDPLLANEQSPISVEDFSALYYEPFHQLMRQTLLGWKMVQHREYNCDEWIHLHVIPEGNAELRERITSPALRSKAAKMSDAWKSVLKAPDRYMTITPEALLRPAFDCPDTRSIARYLETRYWT